MTSKQPPPPPPATAATGSGAAQSSAAANAPTQTASSSTSRRQPLRQARTQPRKLASSRAAVNGVNGGNDTSSHLPPTKFYPALTAFTDALDALPPETIRHLTLLREVDAKACIPEAHLRELIDSIELLPAADDPYSLDPAFEELRKLEDSDFLHTNKAAELLAQLEKEDIKDGTIAGEPETRRARAAQIRTQLQELLVTQDEKIHVVTTANEALQKILSRIEQTFAYVEVEIPSVYRLGNTEHWAYKDPVRRGTAAAQAKATAERERREQEERYNASHAHDDRRRRRDHDDDNEAPRSKKGRRDNDSLVSTKRIAEQQAAQQKRRKTTVAKDLEKDSKATKGTSSPRAGTPAVTAGSKKGKAAQGVARSGAGSGGGGSARR